MRKKIDHVWEAMDAHTQRCKVMGGWIVSINFAGKTLSSVFIADRDHEWMVTNLPAAKAE
jgi:hypothetical protein